MQTVQGPTTVSRRFRAMGCQMQAWLDDDDPAAAAAALADVEALFAHHEQALSRFRPNSELTRVNGRSGRWTPVSPLFWAVLTAALALAELTEGGYDPTLLNALEAAGYARSFEAPQRAGAAAPHRDRRGGRWVDVRLDPARQAVCLPPGARLDFGGVAKGFAAQRAAARLAVHGPCLVDAGGDLCAGAAPRGWPGWPVSVALPGRKRLRPALPAVDDLTAMWLADASLVTSGVDYRRWRQNGRLAHHIIHPDTGKPAKTDLLTATVLLHDAAQADGVATAALVLGRAAALDWLTARDVPALLVDAAGTAVVTAAFAAHIQH